MIVEDLEGLVTTSARIMAIPILGLDARKLGRHIQGAAVTRMDIAASAKDSGTPVGLATLGILMVST
jgi:hypothetical protein